MRVVSNTSPISNLAIIDRLDLLRQRYASVVIPPAVKQELLDLSHSVGRRSIESALRDGWIAEEALPDQTIFAELRTVLDLGEAEAIALAASTIADIILLDERRGRVAARQRGLAVGGVLGELLYAKTAGRVSVVRDEIQRLRRDAHFFIDGKLEAFILAQAGE